MPNSSRLDINIAGMHCAGCAAGIEKDLSRLSGVTDARVNFATQNAAIDFRPDLIDEKEIFDNIVRLGYRPGRRTLSSGGFQSDRLPARARFLTALAFFIPVIIISAGNMFLGEKLLEPRVEGGLLFVLTAIIMFRAGREIFADALRQVRHFRANMNSLIALGSLAAFLYSSYNLVVVWVRPETAGGHYYFETAAAIITLILLGRYLESRAKDRARDAIGALLRLRPRIATAVVDGREVTIDADQIKADMTILVKPGETIPADGVIIEGHPAVNEAMITGEAVPVDKKGGDRVVGGSLNGNTAFKIKVTGAGDETFLAGIIRLVAEAQNRKAPVQKLADRIAGVFVPVVLIMAIITLAVWLLVDPSADMALKAPIAVLIIACPCALGLATPTAVLTGTGRAARRGIYIRGGDILESLNKTSHVIFDKTGTLTEGRFEVVGINSLEDNGENNMLSLAAAAETGSQHPLALALVEEARRRQLDLPTVENLEEFPGFGIRARLNEKSITVGNAATMEREKINFEGLREAAREEMAKGRTVVFAAADNECMGFLALADKIRPEASEVLSNISQSGREVVILTGDNCRTARGVAGLLGVGRFEAEVKPDKKALIVETYQRAGNRVVMVGDGINDAPALAAAEVGVALGCGTDAAIESADIILVQNDLGGVLEMFDVARLTYRTIKQNLFWAFIYNIIAIPLAAGLFYPLLGWGLSPVIGAAAMALSSLFVVSNSLRLLRVGS